jgi:hypothetical protein
MVEAGAADRDLEIHGLVTRLPANPLPVRVPDDHLHFDQRRERIEPHRTQRVHPLVAGAAELVPEPRDPLDELAVRVMQPLEGFVAFELGDLAVLGGDVPLGHLQVGAELGQFVLELFEGAAFDVFDFAGFVVDADEP